MSIDPGLEVPVREQRPTAKLYGRRTAAAVYEVAKGGAGHTQEAGGIIVVEQKGCQSGHEDTRVLSSQEPCAQVPCRRTNGLLLQIVPHGVSERDGARQVVPASG